MDPFWNNIYDEAKDKRYGTLFMAFLMLVIVSPFLLLLFGPASELFGDFLDLVSGYPDLSTFELVCLALVAMLTLVAIVLLGRRWIRIGRKLRQERLKYSNLSRDELLKARSKLKKGMNPVKFRIVERPAKKQAGPTLRAPDTDIKY